MLVPALKERRADFTNILKSKRMHALTELVLLHAHHSSVIAPSGSRRLRALFCNAGPFVQAAVIAIRNKYCFTLAQILPDLTYTTPASSHTLACLGQDHLSARTPYVSGLRLHYQRYFHACFWWMSHVDNFPH